MTKRNGLAFLVLVTFCIAGTWMVLFYNPYNKITIDTFNKLKPGMNREHVEEMLGKPDIEVTGMNDNPRCGWFGYERNEINSIVIQFDDAKKVEWRNWDSGPNTSSLWVRLRNWFGL
jgi:outer membrane protein assembly factor BamE (lipoprotein component of BamABCDE complex)